MSISSPPTSSIGSGRRQHHRPPNTLHLSLDPPSLRGGYNAPLSGADMYSAPLRSPSERSIRSVHSLAPIGTHPCEAEGPSSAPTTQRYFAMERSNPAWSAAASAEGETGESVPLLRDNGPDSGRWYRGPLFMTGVKLSILFAVFSTLVLGTFWFGMPSVDEQDRPALKLPRSFADLQALNALLKKYKDLYPYRIMLCGVVAYLYVQAFTLPGSMYISILLGAAYGIIPGLILSCFCDSTGSILCYTLSSFLGPPLLKLPYYRRMLETWRTKIMGDEKKGTAVGKDSVFAFLLVLRIMPLPPHWVANFVAPHLGIGMGMFWLTCFIGIAPVSVIHVMIGSSLDQMTSADDFKILSPRNILGMAAVIVAVLIPVALKRVFKKDLGDLGDEAAAAVGSAEAAEQGEASLDDIPEAQHVEFDEHGMPKRYHAVDSGVRLAGSIHSDVDESVVSGGRSVLPPMPGSVGSGKGKGRAVAPPDASAFELDDTDVVDPAPQRKAFGFRPAGVTGYGTINIDPAPARPEAKSPWWRFGR